MKRVLVIDSDSSTADLVRESVDGQKWQILVEASLPNALDDLRRGVDMVVLGLEPSDPTGIERLRKLRHADESVPVLVVTQGMETYRNLFGVAAHEDLEFNVMRKPLDAGDLRAVLVAETREPRRVALKDYAAA